MTAPLPPFNNKDSFHGFKEWLFPIIILAFFGWLVNAQMRTQEMLSSLSQEIALVKQAQFTLAKELDTVKLIHELDKRINKLEFKNGEK